MFFSISNMLQVAYMVVVLPMGLHVRGPVVSVATGRNYITFVFKIHLVNMHMGRALLCNLVIKDQLMLPISFSATLHRLAWVDSLALLTIKQLEKNIVTYNLGSSNTRDTTPERKVHGANMGPIWGRQDPGRHHEIIMNMKLLLSGTITK